MRLLHAGDFIVLWQTLLNAANHISGYKLQTMMLELDALAGEDAMLCHACAGVFAGHCRKTCHLATIVKMYCLSQPAVGLLLLSKGRFCNSFNVSWRMDCAKDATIFTFTQPCADTIVGNVMIRGVSGGQRKRVTTGKISCPHADIFFHACQ